MSPLDQTLIGKDSQIAAYGGERDAERLLEFNCSETALGFEQLEDPLSALDREIHNA